MTSKEDRQVQAIEDDLRKWRETREWAEKANRNPDINEAHSDLCLAVLGLIDLLEPNPLKD